MAYLEFRLILLAIMALSLLCLYASLHWAKKKNTTFEYPVPDDNMIRICCMCGQTQVWIENLILPGYGMWEVDEAIRNSKCPCHEYLLKESSKAQIK